MRNLVTRFAFVPVLALLGLLALLLTRSVGHGEVIYADCNFPVSGRGITREVPDQPRKDQKRPPCTERGEVEINGGCWWVLEGAEKPPCEANKFEYQGRCYAPVFDIAERVPTT